MNDDQLRKRLEDLCGELFSAKKAEDEARKARVAIEDEIAALIPTGDNGSKTAHAVNFRVTVKRKLNYKVSDVKIAMIECGDRCFKKVPEKWEFDPKAYEALRVADPAAFRKISSFVEVKAAKPAVELKL